MAAADAKAQPIRQLVDGLDAEVGAVVKAVGQHLAGGGRDEQAGIGVVEVYDAGLANPLVCAGAKQLEEASLVAAVRLDAAVEVEVLGRHVGEHCNVVVDADHALHAERVRRGFDHRAAVAGVDHLAQPCLQLRRLGGGDVLRVGLGPAARAQADGADEACAHAGALKDRGQHCAGGRLAVGACDPNRVEPRRGPPAGAACPGFV